MTLATDEFIRRFLIHVLPKGFHGIRLRAIRQVLLRRQRRARTRAARRDQPADADATDPNEPPTLSHPCPCCGSRMIIIETFARGCQPRHQPSSSTVAIRIDTS
jgi:Putative transposase